jgi:UDP-glucose 4-epimerase
MTVPVVGPEWRIARPASYMLGAPIPDHVQELLHRGRLANGSAIESVLGIAPESSTVDVIDSLYSWPSVIHRPARRQVA